MGKRNRYILTGYRSEGIDLYKPKVSLKKKLVAFGLIGASLIVFDGGVMMIIGGMMLLPISIKSQLKLKLEDCKCFIQRLYYKHKL